MKFNEQDWLKYRAERPEQRYWQCLRNYMGVGYILLDESDNLLPDPKYKDTFYIGDK